MRLAAALMLVGATVLPACVDATAENGRPVVSAPRRATPREHTRHPAVPPSDRYERKLNDILDDVTKLRETIEPYSMEPAGR